MCTRREGGPMEWRTPAAPWSTSLHDVPLENHYIPASACLYLVPTFSRRPLRVSWSPLSFCLFLLVSSRRLSRHRDALKHFWRTSDPRGQLCSPASTDRRDAFLPPLVRTRGDRGRAGIYYSFPLTEYLVITHLAACTRSCTMPSATREPDGGRIKNFFAITISPISMAGHVPRLQQGRKHGVTRSPHTFALSVFKSLGAR